MSYTTLRLGQILLSDLLFLAAAFVIVIKMLSGNDGDLAPAAQRRGSPQLLIGALLLLVGGTLSSLRAWTPVDSIGVVVRFAWVTLVWFWILRTVCRDRNDLRLLTNAWKFSALATSVAAILGQLGIAFTSTHLGDRQVGLNGHPNHLAGQVAASFMLFLLAVPRPAEERSRRRARLTWLLGLGVCATGLFMSGSISGLLAVISGMAVVGVVYLVTGSQRAASRRRAGHRRSPLTPVLALVLVASGALLLFTSNLAVVDRIGLFRQGDTYVEASVDSRGETNEFVTGQFERYLVVGLGFSTGYPSGYIDPNDPSQRNFGVHNMHLGILYQAGLPAVLGVIILLVTAGRQLKVLIRRTDDELYTLTLALIGCFVTVNVVSLFQPTAFDRFFWMPVALGGCLWSVRRRELQTNTVQ